jgi:hypothetical protein
VARSIHFYYTTHNTPCVDHCHCTSRIVVHLRRCQSRQGMAS